MSYLSQLKIKELLKMDLNLILLPCRAGYTFTPFTKVYIIFPLRTLCCVYGPSIMTDRLP